MILKSITLKNIRSYVDETIKFPDNSLLLSGDIGAGKSTILIAIEFCLFGFRPKELDGATLLKHGEKEGSVTLTVVIDEKEIIIKRTLKRGSKSINQTSGYIISDGKKKELTPVELKAEILDILGYPKNILTKSKDLIYRYTVYTPQEDMKSIIIENPENRLDVLRKVFNIDKYRQIRENASIYIRTLKERSKVLEGKSMGIEERKTEINRILESIKDYDHNINTKKTEHETLKTKLSLKQEELAKFEDKLKEMRELKKNFELLDLRLKMKIEEKQRDSADILRVEKQIEDIRKDSKEIEEGREESIKEEMKSKENNLKLLEVKIREMNQKITEFRIIKNNASEIKSKITSLDTCPTCEQLVTEGYKGAIIVREDTKIGTSERNQELYSKQLAASEKELAATRSHIEMLRKETAMLDLNRLKINNMKEKISYKEELEKKQAAIKSEIGEINQKKMIIQQDLTGFSGIEGLYTEIKKDLDVIYINERRLALDINSIEKEKQGMQMMAANLEKEISQKLQSLKSLRTTQETIQWLDQYFINLIAIIEKHVLFSIHSKFDNHVQEWFNILVEDENLQVRLDEQFTPIVTQNGYDAYIENLSGGEKASISLSYRLALNKVIHDLIPDIKTGNLIILDEPTDGFSSNQLDNVRNIIDQLGNKQLIIVSHESKIETFVDNVITIGKDGNTSRVFE
ncbi:MAG: AAA family ATPase [Nanoarchaeota archaeon]|nr:AAA family ATPase [Nanoarchaeota archaeon]